MSLPRSCLPLQVVLAAATLLVAGMLVPTGLLAQVDSSGQDWESIDVQTLEDELDQGMPGDDNEQIFEIASDNNGMWASDGFVFLEGTYIAPPYRVQFTEGKLLINGQAVDYPLPDLVADGRRARFNMARFSELQQIRTVRRIGDELCTGGILVSLTGCPTITLNHPMAREEFLRLLAAGQRVEQVPAALLEQLPASCRAGWTQWLLGYTPPAEAQQRAIATIEAVTAVGNANWANVNAVHRLDKIAYPLTVLGMVVVVMAFGHLLLHRPEAKATERIDESPEVRRLVVRSMLLVVAFSVMDLVWTMLASQAGQMRELNPLGSHLISDPLSLIAFKAVVTAGSVGLILALRKYRTAQVASWWACLICTLLTVRWLVFNSMFVA